MAVSTLQLVEYMHVNIFFFITKTSHDYVLKSWNVLYKSTIRTKSVYRRWLNLEISSAVKEELPDGCSL